MSVQDKWMNAEERIWKSVVPICKHKQVRFSGLNNLTKLIIDFSSGLLVVDWILSRS